MSTLDTTCGPIKLGETLGKGELGVVYSGTQLDTGRRVAVKLIRAKVHDETVVRFFSDARTVSNLRHPNAAEIISTGRTSDGRTYVVTEHPEGRTLSALLVQQYRVSVQTALQWTVQILGALDSAHAAGVVHRGLKPSNVFVVEPPRRTPFIKVLDFGVARLSKSPRNVGYLAPEQVGPSKSISYATDLYALGCVMFELISGRPPFSSTDTVRKSLPVLSQVLPGIPRPLEQYVEWLMQRLPTSRPQTAEMALEHALALQEIFPRRRSTPTPLPAPMPVSSDRTFVMAAEPKANQVHVPASPPMSLRAAESQVTIVQRVRTPAPPPVALVDPEEHIEPTYVRLDAEDDGVGYEPTFLRPSLPAAEQPIRLAHDEVPTQPGLLRALVPPTREAPASVRHDEPRPTIISRAQSRPDLRQLFEDVEAVSSQQLADELFGDIEGEDEVQVDAEGAGEEPSLAEQEEALLRDGAPPVTLRMDKPAAPARPKKRTGLKLLAAMLVLAIGGGAAWKYAPPEMRERASERVQALIVELKGRLPQT